MSNRELELFKKYCKENNLSSDEDYINNRRDNCFKDTVYSYYQSGGASGGGYSEESYPLKFEKERPSNYDPMGFLITIFTDFNPNITYLQAEKIKGELRRVFDCETIEERHDYYGNYDEYYVDYIKIDDLYSVLKRNGMGLERLLSEDVSIDNTEKKVEKPSSKRRGLKRS